MAIAAAVTCTRLRVNRARFLIFSLFRSADMGLHYRRCAVRPEGDALAIWRSSDVKLIFSLFRPAGSSLVLGFVAISRSSGDLLRQVIDLADDVVALFGQRSDFIPNQLPLCDRNGLQLGCRDSQLVDN